MSELGDGRGLMLRVEIEDASRRIRLVTERTYLAWLRSGLTALAVGLAAGKLVPEPPPLITRRGISCGFPAEASLPGAQLGAADGSACGAVNQSRVHSQTLELRPL